MCELHEVLKLNILLLDKLFMVDLSAYERNGKFFFL